MKIRKVCFQSCTKIEVIRTLKAHANGRKPMLGPRCCVRLHGTATILALVACSSKLFKLLKGPCKRTQQVTISLRVVGSFWPTMLRPFAWA